MRAHEPDAGPRASWRVAASNAAPGLDHRRVPVRAGWCTEGKVVVVPVYFRGSSAPYHLENPPTRSLLVDISASCSVSNSSQRTAQAKRACMLPQAWPATKMFICDKKSVELCVSSGVNARAVDQCSQCVLCPEPSHSASPTSHSMQRQQSSALCAFQISGRLGWPSSAASGAPFCIVVTDTHASAWSGSRAYTERVASSACGQLISLCCQPSLGGTAG